MQIGPVFCIKNFLIVLTILVIVSNVFSQDALSEEEFKELDHSQLTQKTQELIQKENGDKLSDENLTEEELFELKEMASEIASQQTNEHHPIKFKEKFKKDINNPSKSGINQKLSDSITLALLPLRKLEEKKLLELLNQKMQESSYYGIYKQHPKIGILTVKLIKDPVAIPQLIKIIENKQRLINFFSAMFLTIILSFLIRLLYNWKKKNFFHALTFFIFKFFFIWGIRYLVIIFFFKEELYPAVRIFINII